VSGHDHLSGHPTHGNGKGKDRKDALEPPRLVAWEVTRNCNLSCIHCRAAADKGPHQGELSTESCLELLDQIRQVGRPIVILTGGEPLLREDIFRIARYGTDRGLRMVMAPNGTLLNETAAEQSAQAGIERISISLDGATAASHDRFRGVSGAYEGALAGIRNAKKAGLSFQINTTVTRQNLAEVPKIQDLAVAMGAAAHHVFLLVPTGRGKYLGGQEISAQQYEDTLNWLYEQREKVPLQLKATCAPHYYRILRQRAHAEGKPVDFKNYGLDAVTRGCLAGTGFCFISHVGIVQPCGFLDIPCGDVTRQSFDQVWRCSQVFTALRDPDGLKGKCGRCEFRRVCGGCRARAFEATGDYLAEEPLCSYVPANLSDPSFTKAV